VIAASHAAEATVPDVTALGDLEERCVRPFYREVFGLNALSHPVRYEALAELGRGTTDEEVIALLRAGWRARVMGAWLAAGRDGQEVAQAVLTSLKTSGGSLTAPPLAAVAVFTSGVEAVSALRTYVDVDLQRGHGSAGFIRAALEHVSAGEGPVQAPDRDALSGMLDVAERLARLSD
jgi:hypothetical protein